jgi:hypothetical protein
MKTKNLTVYALWRSGGSVMALLKTAQGAVPVLLSSTEKFDLGKLDSLRRGWATIDSVEFRAWPRGKRMSMFQCPDEAEVVDTTFRFLKALPDVPVPVREMLPGLRIVVITAPGSGSKTKKCDVEKKTPASEAIMRRTVNKAARLLYDGLTKPELSCLLGVLTRHGNDSTGGQLDVSHLWYALVTKQEGSTRDAGRAVRGVASRGRDARRGRSH